MAKRAKISRKRIVSKDPDALNLTIEDVQWYGEEPDFRNDTITDENRNAKLGNALNWYSKIFDQKMTKDFVGQWLRATGRVEDAKLLLKVPDNYITQTVGAMCRLAQYRGWPLSEKEINFINDKVMTPVNRWYEENKKDEEALDTEKEKKPERKTVQEIMRERTHEVGGEIDGLIDEFIYNLKAKSGVDHSSEVIKLLNDQNILPQHTNILVNYYEKEKSEFVEVLSGEDEQLNEGYSHLTKTQIKNIIAYYDKVIGAINSYNVLKIKTRAKRARKPVSIDKLVSKLKYMRKFEDEANNLKLESVHPKDLHLKKEAWVYDTGKRKLHHYVADSLGGELFIKGNTLCGFDKSGSQIKTLRKPGEQIKQVMGSKPAARQFFDKIKAVAVQPNGRFNDKMIILKAF